MMIIPENESELFELYSEELRRIISTEWMRRRKRLSCFHPLNYTYTTTRAEFKRKKLQKLRFCLEICKKVVHSFLVEK